MDDPCRWCCDYPYHCRGMCRDKMKYMQEVNEDVPVIRGLVKVIIDNNKNGIRRETVHGNNRRQSKRGKQRRRTRSI